MMLIIYGGNYCFSVMPLYQSIATYSKIIEANPNNAEAYIVRGKVYHTIAHATHGKMQEAIKDYNQAIRLNPSIPWFYYLRRVAHQAEGNFDAAKADFEYFLRSKPTLNVGLIKNRLIIMEQMKSRQKP